ncbi:hypothetical protein L1887_07979 [Cichorium endivia]|nr:hypothetical protein L1887_07979 [Cichorium endivia]
MARPVSHRHCTINSPLDRTSTISSANSGNGGLDGRRWTIGVGATSFNSITSFGSKIPSLLQIVPVSILDDDNNSSAMFSNDLADTKGSLLPCLS